MNRFLALIYISKIMRNNFDTNIVLSSDFIVNIVLFVTILKLNTFFVTKFVLSMVALAKCAKNIFRDELCKHAVMCQYRAGTGPMLAASAQYRTGTGT